MSRLLWDKGRMRYDSVWVSGATGSWGSEICRQLLAAGIRRVVAYCRGETRAANLVTTLNTDRVRIRIGDVRDAERVAETIAGCDLVIHAAALKRIDGQVSDNLEMARTNVDGTINVIRACARHRPHRAILISSDKAVLPTTFYGATKMTAEGLWIAGNAYAPPPHPCHFRVFRSGNALGSTGSVLHIWKSQRERGEPLTLTNPDMTRFHITLHDAAANVLRACQDDAGTDIVVPEMPAYTIRSLLLAYAKEDESILTIGSRGFGEKMHEMLSIGGVTSNDVRQLTVDELKEILRAEGWNE